MQKFVENHKNGNKFINYYIGETDILFSQVFIDSKKSFDPILMFKNFNIDSKELAIDALLVLKDYISIVDDFSKPEIKENK